MPVLKCFMFIVGHLCLCRVEELEISLLACVRNIENSLRGCLQSIALELKGSSVLKLCCSASYHVGASGGGVGLLSFLGTMLCDVGHSELLGWLVQEQGEGARR